MCRFVVWSKETIACQRVYIKRECVNSVCGLFPSVACREEEGRGNKQKIDLKSFCVHIMSFSIS